MKQNGEGNVGGIPLTQELPDLSQYPRNSKQLTNVGNWC